MAEEELGNGEEAMDLPAPLFPPEPAGIEDASAAVPKLPTTPLSYNLNEPVFWDHGHMPLGSVLVIRPPGFEEDDSAPQSAVLVTGRHRDASGYTLDVKFMGASTPAEKSEREKLVKKNGIHLCILDGDGVCGDFETSAYHVTNFDWYPPGDFRARWLSKGAVKTISEAKDMESGHKDGRPPKAMPGGVAEGGDPSEIQQRLDALKRKSALSQRVSFAPQPMVIPAERSSRELGLQAQQTAAVAGPMVRPPASSSPWASWTPPIKAEGTRQQPIQVDSASESQHGKSSSSKRKKMGQTLAQAAIAQAKVGEAKDQKEKKKKKKKKKDKKKSKKDSSSDEETESESSSDAEMMPPLKKKSLKSPGSVYKMLEEHAIEALAQDGVVEEAYDPSKANAPRPKIHTYFQLVLRPNLDPKTRDCKELGMLSRALDLLREGRLSELADALAARFQAVDTATRQGWNTAKHLEIYGGEEEGSVPAHVLLQAQKYTRQVEKAGGKGSWGKNADWRWSDWQYGGSPKGKGKEPKGKGKPAKGKNKGKGNWKNDGKEKDEKDKKES